jgi:hypothetical protein
VPCDKILGFFSEGWILAVIFDETDFLNDPELLVTKVVSVVEHFSTVLTTQRLIQEIVSLAFGLSFGVIFQKTRF